MSLNVKNVNGRMSKRNSLYIVSARPTVPLLNSIVLARPTPILVPAEDPLVTVAVSKRDICLYAVASFETAEISGLPNTLLILTKLPTSKEVIPALTVLKSLALFISLNVGAIFSSSYPLTYALPGDTLRESKELDAVLPSSVVVSATNTPSFSLTVTHSLSSN